MQGAADYSFLMIVIRLLPTKKLIYQHLLALVYKIPPCML